MTCARFGPLVGEFGRHKLYCIETPDACPCRNGDDHSVRSPDSPAESMAHNARVVFLLGCVRQKAQPYLPC